MNDVVQPGALRLLLTQLGGDRGAQRRFVADFVDLWDTRSRRLAQALAAPDAGGAHIALLSIRSSCGILGAVRLEAAATVMLALLADGDVNGCRERLPQLIIVGERTCAWLNSFLES